MGTIVRPQGPSRTRAASGAATILALICMLLAAGALHAQSTVTIQGRITNTDGQPLQGVQVALENRETGRTRGTLTGVTGTFTLVGLPPGRYEIVARSLGYGTERRQFQILLGQRAQLDFVLQREAVAIEGIDVVGVRESSSFEVQRTDVSVPVIQAEITNLPLNTRNTMNLAAIVPGIKTYAPTAGRSLPSSGSLPELRFWNFYLDGAEWKSMFNGNLVGIPQTGSPIPQEAIREFRVHLNPYDAQFTRGGSFVMSAVTHRGTNEFQGSGFIYHQNNSLTAHDEFQRRSRATNPNFARPDYERQQLGFNLRGPVVRDRLFFAGSYELNNTDNAIAVIPGRPAFNPGVWDRYSGTFTAPTKNHTGVLRLTAPHGENHTFDLIYAGRVYASETSFGGTMSRDAGITADYTIHSLMLRNTYTPRPTLLNEFSLHWLAWNHAESPLVPGPQFSYPSVTVGRAGFPLELQERHLRAINKVTWTPQDSRHTLSGGVELSRISTDSYQPSNRNGLFTFPTDTSTIPSRATIGVGFFDPSSTEDARALTDGWIAGIYVQNRWQTTDRLTLNLGLRWDAEINTLNNDFTVPWASDPDLRGNAQLARFLNEGDRENDLNNLAPRFSFSYDLFGRARTFLRGGAGIMYDRVATFIAFNEKVSSGWRTYDFNNPGTTDPNVLRQRVISGAGASTPNLVLLKDRMETPRNRQFSLGVGHQFSPVLSTNVDYINQHATNLYVSTNANYFIPSQGRRAITPRYGNIILWDDFGEAKFHSFVSSLTYQRGAARANLAYTFGWYESMFDGSPAQNYPFASSYVMQRSGGDERHRAALSFIAPLPYAFQLSGVAILATPTPFNVTLGRDLNNNQILTDDWPDGIRTMRPDGSWEHMYRTVDLRLTKSLPVAMGRMSLSAEAFNVFNWTNWSGYSGRMGDERGNPLANFGQPSGVYAPRQAQVGLRYAF
jgi:hypothetical protein